MIKREIDVERFTFKCWGKKKQRTIYSMGIIKMFASVFCDTFLFYKFTQKFCKLRKKAFPFKRIKNDEKEHSF